MYNPFRMRRAVIAATGAALLLAGAAGANAAGGPQPGTMNLKEAGPDKVLVNPAMAPGSELQFIAVAPCRIIDTRKAGGAISARSRVFDATLASYATQGGKVGTCNIPDVATSVQLNLGAISSNNKTSDVKGWATGTTEPTASMVNYNPSGPVANMVTMPLNATGQFTLRTPGAVNVFADVAGYYVKPLYVSIDGQDLVTEVFGGVASGYVSSTKEGTGVYTVTFDRNVTSCVANATDYLFPTVHEFSIDSTFSEDSTLYIEVKDSSTGIHDDTVFHLSLTC